MSGIAVGDIEADFLVLRAPDGSGALTELDERGEEHATAIRIGDAVRVECRVDGP